MPSCETLRRMITLLRKARLTAGQCNRDVPLLMSSKYMVAVPGGPAMSQDQGRNVAPPLLPGWSFFFWILPFPLVRTQPQTLDGGVKLRGHAPPGRCAHQRREAQRA